ncbi:MAG: hypothetical protein RR482_07145 [Clostridia bacterium]
MKNVRVSSGLIAQFAAPAYAPQEAWQCAPLACVPLSCAPLVCAKETDATCSADNAPDFCRFACWWKERRVQVHTLDGVIEGVPITLEGGILRVIDAEYSYLVSVSQIVYIRTERV